MKDNTLVAITGNRAISVENGSELNISNVTVTSTTDAFYFCNVGAQNIDNASVTITGATNSTCD